MKAGLAQAESCCVYVKPKKMMKHMHGITPCLFDCCTDPVVHLLLLKSSMDKLEPFSLKGGKYLCNECLVPLVSFGNLVSVTRLGDLLDFGQLF